MVILTGSDLGTSDNFKFIKQDCKKLVAGFGRAGQLFVRLAFLSLCSIWNRGSKSGQDRFGES